MGPLKKTLRGRVGKAWVEAALSIEAERLRAIVHPHGILG
jgi:hypothetical protein